MGRTIPRLSSALIALALLSASQAAAQNNGDSQPTGAQAGGGTTATTAQADGSASAMSAPASGGNGPAAGVQASENTPPTVWPAGLIVSPDFGQQSPEAKALADKIAAQDKELADKVKEQRKDIGEKFKELLSGIAQGNTEETKKLTQEIRDARKLIQQEVTEERKLVAQEIKDAIDKGVLKGKPSWVNFLHHYPIEPFWANFLHRKPGSTDLPVVVKWPVDMTRLKIDQPATDPSKVFLKLENQPVVTGVPGNPARPANSPDVVVTNEKPKLVNSPLVVLPADTQKPVNLPVVALPADARTPMNLPVVALPADARTPVNLPVVALPAETPKPVFSPGLVNPGGGSQTMRLPKIELSGDTFKPQGQGFGQGLVQPGSIQISGKPVQVQVKPQLNLNLQSGQPAFVKPVTPDAAGKR